MKKFNLFFASTLILTLVASYAAAQTCPPTFPGDGGHAAGNIISATSRYSTIYCNYTNGRGVNVTKGGTYNIVNPSAWDKKAYDGAPTCLITSDENCEF